MKGLESIGQVTLELTDEERDFVRRWIDVVDSTAPMGLLVAIRIIRTLQAGKMKAGWRYEHRNCVETKDGTILCTVGGGVNRHTWTDEQWLEAAKVKFMEDK